MEVPCSAHYSSVCRERREHPHFSECKPQCPFKAFSCFQVEKPRARPFRPLHTAHAPFIIRLHRAPRPLAARSQIYGPPCHPRRSWHRIISMHPLPRIRGDYPSFLHRSAPHPIYPNCVLDIVDLWRIGLDGSRLDNLLKTARWKHHRREGSRVYGGEKKEKCQRLVGGMDWEGGVGVLGVVMGGFRWSASCMAREEVLGWV